MSTDTTPDTLLFWADDRPGARRRPRNHPPEPLLGPPHVNYPGSDGRPMADNTLQDEWITTIKGGLDIVFADDPDVVFGNHLWYPVEGNNRRRLAPDVMVVFGRPKGYRTSYVQHREEDIPPQVVFEIHSPGNRRRVMDYKLRFYERHGVEEYYHFDPYKIRMDGWLRDGDVLGPIAQTNGWTSPLSGIRFELAEKLRIFGPDGRPFLTFVENARESKMAEQFAREAVELAKAERRATATERRKARAERRKADRESVRADAERANADAERANSAIERRNLLAERHQADLERARAETERANAEDERRKAGLERARADMERDRADRLAARLRALGIDPEELAPE